MYPHPTSASFRAHPLLPRRAPLPPGLWLGWLWRSLLALLVLAARAPTRVQNISTVAGGGPDGLLNSPLPQGVVLPGGAYQGYRCG